jgi:hypothetical protein
MPAMLTCQNECPVRGMWASLLVRAFLSLVCLGVQHFVRSQPGVSLNGTTDKARDSTAWAPNPVVHQNGGLVVASRYPIVSSRFVPFNQASLHESVNWKVRRFTEGLRSITNIPRCVEKSVARRY